MLDLQRTAGNAAVAAMVATGPLLHRQFDVASPVRDWSAVTNITRSSGGVTSGVVFASTANGDRLVLKFMNDAAGAQFADEVISGALGIRTPSSKVLGKAETKAAKAKVKERLSDIGDPAKRKNVKAQLKSEYIQVQEFAHATGLDQLAADDVKWLLGHQHIIEQIGSLAMADALLANYDRITRTQANLGNLMLTPHGELMAIDNSAVVNDNSHAVSIQDIDFLLSDGGPKALAATLAAPLLRRLPLDDQMAVDLDAIERWLKRGIMEGAVALYTYFTPDVMVAAENLEATMPGPKKSGRALRWREMRTRLEHIRAKALALIG